MIGIRTNVPGDYCMNHLLEFSLNQKISIELIYLNISGDFSQRTVIVRKIYEDGVLYAKATS